MPAPTPHLHRILDCGERLLLALDGDDFKLAAACAHERDVLVEGLGDASPLEDAVLAAQLGQQDRLLAERAQAAYDRLSASMRQAERFHQAASSYAPPPKQGRLHAHG